MRRFRYLLPLVALWALTQPAQAGWWPGEPYCKFINAIHLDRTWVFDTSINDDNAPFTSETRSNITPTQEAPGYICWNVVSWDNRTGGREDDHDLDWCQLELYNKATNEYHQICMLDFLPEHNDGNEWYDNYRNEGNFNITTDPQWYRNMNNCETRYVKKRLYRNWDDGIMFCFFVTKYSDETRRFIERAGNNLQVYLKGRWDDNDWRDFYEYSDWHPGAFLNAPAKPASAVLNGFEDNNGETRISVHVPATDAGCKMLVNQVEHYSSTPEITADQDITGSERDVLLPIQNINSFKKLNEMQAEIAIRQQHDYPQNRDGWHDHGKYFVPANIRQEGDEMKLEIPQMRIGRLLRLSNVGDGSVKLEWTVDVPDEGRRYDASDWVIERSLDKRFPKAATFTKMVPYEANQKSMTVLDTFPDRQQGELTYYYRVRRAHEITNSDFFRTSSFIPVQTDYVKIQNFDVAPGGTTSVQLNWELTSGVWPTGDNGMHLEVWRDGNEVTAARVSDFEANGGYEVTGQHSCEGHDYELRIVDNGILRSTMSHDRIVLPDGEASIIDSYSQSKGFFNDRVELNWRLDENGQNFHHFVVKRKVHGPDEQYKTLANSISRTDGVLDYAYTDNSVVPGVIYDYQLEGWTNCDTLVMPVCRTGVGFAQPYGIVTGQVLFESGQPVPGVTIDMSSQNTTTGSSLELGEGSYATLTNTQGVLQGVGGTVEMQVLLKPGVTGYRPFFEQAGAFSFGLENDSLQFAITHHGQVYHMAAPLGDSARWVENAFNHVAFSYRQAGDSLQMALFANGYQIGDSVIHNLPSLGDVGTATAPIEIGRRTVGGQQTYLKAYLSDLRFWNDYRSPEQIKQYHDCFLNGKEDNLSAYYRFSLLLQDETYDISGDGTHFNERHLQVENGCINPAIQPTTTQLGLRARTDADGNYLINAVPFEKNGTLYTMVAGLGVHQFSPATKTLFFDQNASTHNSIDFTDISSFTVSGKICYAGGNYPVEGIQFKVDGTVLNSKKGGAIQSQADGTFAISVPVGTHSVQAFREGHTLSNDGFITDIDGSDIDFQREYSGITLYDSTRVRFIGRVCGGLIQSKLPVGHTISRNNLGDGIYLLLEHPKRDIYQLATQPWTETLVHQTPSIYAIDSLNPNRKAVKVSNEVKFGENEITIYVNDSTGEFYADVYPINYTIRLSHPKYGNADEHGQTISFANLTSQASNVELRPYTDSLLVQYVGDSMVWSLPEKYTDSISYVKKQVFCFRQQPTIDFYQCDDAGRRLPYFGVDYIKLTRGDSIWSFLTYNDTLPEEQRYTLGKPVFTPNNSYRMHGFVCEVYHHYQGDDILWSDSVPTTDAVLNINNTMSIQPDMRLAVDSMGQCDYLFTLTNPDLVNARGALSIRVQHNNNKKSFAWQVPFGEDNSGYCYFLGSQKKSNDFITAGPQNLVTILRDPPGSGSYAYLDKGHTINSSRKYAYTVFENGKNGLDFNFGFSATAFYGVGVAVKQAVSHTESIKTGYQHDNTGTSSTTLNTTMTTTQRYATSAAETKVGAGADVFVGHADNYSLAIAEQIVLVDSAVYNKYGATKYKKVYGQSADSAAVLALCEGISCGERFATTFEYTQDDIISQEIPRLEKLIPQILQPFSAADTAAYNRSTDSSREPLYMCNPGVTPASPDYAQPGSYFILFPTSEAERLGQDTISTIKGWISDWKYYLGLNEYQKWAAHNSNKALVENFSISGGATLTMTESYTTAMTYAHNRVNKHNFFINRGGSNKAESAAYFNIEFLLEENAGNAYTNEESNSNSYTHTKGFVIAPNNYERLSVDVLRPADWSEDDERESHVDWHQDDWGNETEKVNNEATIKSLKEYPSFLFYTRGGQTCCPYEPSQAAKYMEHFLERTIEADSVKGDMDLMAVHKAELQKIKGKTIIINGGTDPIDVPQLEVKNALVDGVPTGEAAHVTIYMSNGSSSGTDRPYWLILKESSNPNGAQIAIDGTGIGTGLTGGSGLSYLIPAGSTLEKTVEVRKGSVLEYDDLMLYMVAYCDAYKNKLAIRDSCKFSVHFTPACSGIKIKSPGNNWVYNSELDSMVNPLTQKMERYLPIELNEFDVNYDSFDHIELQYKPSSDSESRWRKAQFFYKNQTMLDAAVAAGKDPSLCSLCKDGSIRYSLFLDELEDQQYDIRAVTFCADGNDMVENYSDVVSGIKDTYKPRLFGEPKPANGILTINDEIRLDFNEDIAGGKLTYNNFSVTGILDEDVSDRQIAIHLSGDGRLRTEGGISLENEYTLEGYFRQTDANGQQQLFRLGNAPDNMSLTLDKAADCLIFEADKVNVRFPLEGRWQEGQWNHVAVHRENHNTQMTMSVEVNFVPLNGWDNSVSLRKHLIGPMTIGDGFVGDIDQVRLWTEVRTAAQLRASSTSHLSATSVGLLCCYNIDENQGTTLEDVSSERTMQVENGTWVVPAGRALHLDGKAYATLPVSSCPVDPYQDYSLDCWFRAEAGTNGTLLTSPLFDGQLADNGLSVALNEQGQLVVESSGGASLVSSYGTGYNDHQWHHVFFSVGRTTGFARLYVDGHVVATVTQDKVDGLVGSYLYVGATPNIKAVPNSTDDTTFGNWFHGEIDEIRLLPMYTSQFQVEQFHMHKTDSAMAGLSFYYPFERYETSNIGISSLVFSTRNFCKEKSSEQALLHGAVASNEAAPVATTSAITRFDQTGFTFTPSDNAVILTLTKPLARIEHTILTFTAQNVRDVHGNRMLSPVTWSAYIDRNPLVVENKYAIGTTMVNEPIIGSFHITNRSGAYRHYTVQGIPSWITFFKESGTIEPDGEATLGFVTSESLSIGTHTAHLYLINSDDVVIPLSIVVIVKGNEPNYEVDESKYPCSMNIMGQIEIDGVRSTDTNDMLLVFSDKECVGKGYTTYYYDQDAYYVNLTVYSENTKGHPLTYLIYDASTGRSYLADCHAAVFNYQHNAIIGSPANPAVFFNTTSEYRSYELQKGWNWLSQNLYVQGGNTTNNILGTGWTANDQIKLFDARNFAAYSVQNKRWEGNLAHLDSTQLLMLYSAEPRQLLVKGKPFDYSETYIPVVNGWNGIAYLPDATLSVKEAMALFDDVRNDDVIKSQTQFAIYYNGEWLGSLNTLHPGEGYMLKHNGPDTKFRYPKLLAMMNQAPMRTPVLHETTMSMVARPEGVELQEGDLLTVFAGDEQVGQAKLQSGIWYISIAGDHAEQQLRFVCTSGKRSATSYTAVSYRANAVVGSVGAPEPIHFGELKEDTGVEKRIRDNQLIIIRDGRTYNALGIRLE